MGPWELQVLNRSLVGTEGRKQWLVSGEVKLEEDLIYVELLWKIFAWAKGRSHHVMGIWGIESTNPWFIICIPHRDFKSLCSVLTPLSTLLGFILSVVVVWFGWEFSCLLTCCGYGTELQWIIPPTLCVTGCGYGNVYSYIKMLLNSWLSILKCHE